MKNKEYYKQKLCLKDNQDIELDEILQFLGENAVEELEHASVVNFENIQSLGKLPQLFQQEELGACELKMVEVVHKSDPTQDDLLFPSERTKNREENKKDKLKERFR